jgi:hypothetical protein
MQGFKGIQIRTTFWNFNAKLSRTWKKNSFWPNQEKTRKTTWERIRLERQRLKQNFKKLKVQRLKSEARNKKVQAQSSGTEEFLTESTQSMTACVGQWEMEDYYSIAWHRRKIISVGHKTSFETVLQLSWKKILTLDMKRLSIQFYQSWDWWTRHKQGLVWPDGFGGKSHSKSDSSGTRGRAVRHGYDIKNLSLVSNKHQAIKVSIKQTIGKIRTNQKATRF